MITENSTIESIKEEIDKNINDLLESVFSDENYNLNLRNLIKSISFITSGIQESVEFIRSDKTKVNEVLLKRIEEQCYCISSLCDTIHEKLNPDDFVTVSNLIYSQKMYQLGFR